MLDRATSAGVLQDFRVAGIISLQYADHTILFSSVELPYLLNIKHVIMWFEQISGMRVNFHKTQLITMNVEEDVVHQAAHIFNCLVGCFPLKYLGVPLHYYKLSREFSR